MALIQRLSSVLILLSVINGAPINLIDDEKLAKDYLISYGYYEIMPLPRESIDLADMERIRQAQLSLAIKKFQIFADLPISGELDEQTKAQMGKRRCGVADLDRLKKDGSASPKWTESTLTWSIDDYSPQVDQGLTRSAMTEAFNVWQSVIPIDFVEVSPQANQVDIRIRFAKRSHDDAWPFDGPGRVLAHAMYPPDGRCHFDDDEDWVYRDPARAKLYEHTDLLHVAVHELGHALGLGHSSQQSAVMAPFYAADTATDDGSLALHADDVRAIQAVYGRRGAAVEPPPTTTTTTAPSTTTTTTTQASTTTTTTPAVEGRWLPPPQLPPVLPFFPNDEATPDECPTHVDAAAQTFHGVRYIFSGGDVWQVDAHLKLLGRQRLADVFEGPQSVNAAVTNPRSQFMLLFEGRRVWAYLWSDADKKFQLATEFPKQLSEEIEFAPEAAFEWRDGNIVITQGGNFAIYDEYWNVATMVELTSSYFPTYPTSGVQAALPLSAGAIHIFKLDGDIEYDALSGETQTTASIQC